MNFVSAVKSIKQQVFVVIAFALMTVVSCVYVGAIVGEQNKLYAENALKSAEGQIRLCLSEAENTLDNFIIIRDKGYFTGTGREQMQDDLIMWSHKMSENAAGFNNFLSIYGYVNGQYVDGDGWDPFSDPDAQNYIPALRPWYTGAESADGGFFYTDLYIDAYAHESVVSVSKQVRDENGKPCGVLAIDLNATALGFISGLRIKDSGYAILLNGRFDILTHPDSALIGKNAFDAYPDFKAYEWNIIEQKRLLGASVADIDGKSSVSYVYPIYNGWYIASFTPSFTYYSDIYFITVILIVLAALLAAALCYTLTKLNRQMARSEMENLSKSSFLARISHEIRTPMNTIAGMSELILRKNVEPLVFEYATAIKNASGNLLSIINDILDYSRLEAGNIDIIQSEYLFSSLLNDVLSITRIKLTDKPVRFVVNTDSAIPRELIGDEARIRQILLNVLSNAVKYTQDGYVSLTVLADVNLEQKTVVLTFEISDTGVGIEEESINKIFGDFVKLDIDGSKTIQGAGLGLAITKNLCATMGGSISVYSKYGEGSLFTVSVPQRFEEYKRFAHVEDADKKEALVFEPRLIYANSVVSAVDNLGVKCTLAVNESMFYDELKQDKYRYVFVSSFMLRGAMDIIKRLMLGAALVLLAEHKETLNVPNVKIIYMPAHALVFADVLNDVNESFAYNAGVPASAGFVAPKARVLIVDDIKTNLQVAEGLMAPYKMLIDTVTSGSEAIEKIKSVPYDLVFMDHMMPEMDGIEATHRIRNLDKGDGYYKKLPIVALTANAMAGMKEKFIQSGMDDFLPKPIELTKLNAILETWIPKRLMERNTEGAAKQTREPEYEFEIRGIDVKKGLVMTGGQWKSYEKTLTTYYYDAKDKIPEISEYLENGDLTAYATLVHALKSASGSIGAGEISSLAATLEDAAKGGDIQTITKNTGDFIKKLEDLVAALEISVIKSEPGSEETESNIPYLHETLDKLKTALEEIDMTAIDELVLRLESMKWDAELGEAVKNISRDILLFEYEAAIEIINDILVKYIE